MKKLLLLSALAVTMGAEAQVTPKVQPEVPVSGQSYILVNRVQKADQYMSRTSWDGAFYFLPEAASNWAKYAFTAFDNGDGTWSFGIPMESEEGAYDYIAFPEGSPNLNAKATEPVMWKLDAKANGFYNLILDEGQNYVALATATGGESETPTKDLRMHLNANADFFVVNYYNGPFFGDIFGGINVVENEEQGTVMFEANDSTSFDWGFVSVENVEAYYRDLQSCATINNFLRNYCDMDEYADGFLMTYNAAADIYNSESYTEDDCEIIKAMINGKIDLYNEIEAAQKLMEEYDAALSKAIDDAKEIFDAATSAEEVDAALTALKDAEDAYSLGSGDVTSFGVNMSFEDLSAQGGSQTSGVAGAPKGWNIYINGKQVVTADEARAAGMGAWHGVNDDCSGDIKDGNMGFGIWNGSIPDYELSQTITGLANGTYEITAGLMAGSNGAGSRLTTQRIFGNLNSTYYGSEFDYNLEQLDNSEVYSFMENEILSTDREMLPVTVKAFVYDGTLTFGVRTNGNYAANNRESGNGAGGDGWFKVDNFKIISKGYIAEDAVAMFDFYAEKFDEYYGQQMSAAVQAKLDEIDLGSVTVDTPQEDLVAAIALAKDLIAEVAVSVKDYGRLMSAIESNFDSYELYSSKAGAADYLAAIEAAEVLYYDGELNTTEEIDSLINSLKNALQECIQSDDIEEGSDLTEYIANPSFEDLSAQNNRNSDGVENAPAGWSLYVEGQPVQKVPGAGWAAINAGDNLDIINSNGDPVYHQYTDGEHVWGVWSGSIPVLELSQTIKGLPAGTYTLTADIVVQNDWAGKNLTSQRLFVNDYVTLFGGEFDYVQNIDDELHGAFPEDVLVAEEIDALNPDAEVKHLNYAANYSQEDRGASGAPYTTSVVFGLAKPGDITFGFRTNRVSAVTGQVENQASLGWFKLDNFRLVYNSTEVPAGAETTAESTAVESVKAMNSSAVEFYSVSGSRLSAPQKGINIVKMANGTASKVFVK